MKIFPAIDMLGGCAVRLFQGDYNQQQTFGQNPALFAAQFAADGAKYLHLVDLDGARQGRPANFDIVKQIASESPLFIELGGGIRDAETVQACFDAGVGRVILGTAALQNPAFTRQMVAAYGDKIAVGVDARDGKVAVEGWLATSETDSFDFCREMQAIGVQYIIYTDISCDGAGRGTNLPVYERLATLQSLHITASGGVSTLEDITALRDMGLYAAILGKALYTGSLLLPQAIAVAGAQI